MTRRELLALLSYAPVVTAQTTDRAGQPELRLSAVGNGKPMPTKEAFDEFARKVFADGKRPGPRYLIATHEVIGRLIRWYKPPEPPELQDGLAVHRIQTKYGLWFLVRTVPDLKARTYAVSVPEPKAGAYAVSVPGCMDFYTPDVMYVPGYGQPK